MSDMKVHWFSVLSVAVIVLLSGKSFGGELQWKKPVNNEPVASSVICIPSIITTDDEATSSSSAILQVQRLEPIQPPRMPQPSASQLDFQYPELRPQTQTPLSGATLQNIPTPTTVRNVPPMPPSDVRTKTDGGMVVACGEKVSLKSIKEISHDIRPTSSGELPEECVIDSVPYNGRHFNQSCFQWKASAVCTKAAYFEDVQLERYGHTVVCPVLQPVVSGAKFFATVPMLPYKMGVTPPNECVYTLGHYQAGSCSPYMVEPFPISARGALFQTGAVAGAVLAIP